MQDREFFGAGDPRIVRFLPLTPIPFPSRSIPVGESSGEGQFFVIKNSIRRDPPCKGESHVPNLVQHRVEPVHYVLVAHPDHLQPDRFQPGGAVGVVLHLGIMHASIDFDHQHFLGAVEIDDEIAKGNLPSEFEPAGSSPAQRVPQPRLGGCLFAAQFTRTLPQQRILDVAIDFCHGIIMAEF